ncbi:hypothetical protein UD02_07150 [Campylobacter coli]|nr:hypothetical protein UD02_07150 [Campylobacter coli]
MLDLFLKRFVIYFLKIPKISQIVIDIIKKYTANDIQDLNHGKNTINSDEIIEKVRFVVEIIDKIRNYSCGKL